MRNTNNFLSGSSDKLIIICDRIVIVGQKKWTVRQKIKVDQYGFRLCFINNNQFTFQPYCYEQMQIYQIDSNTKQYRKTKSIAVKCGSNDDSFFFPQQYLKSKCLLVNKNGNNVNLMRMKENNDFIIEQSIEFGHSDIYRQLSQDGEYLIT
ncbi:unnamed protein product [Paramecium sonneborni]|uniref:Uncharacterized protein n=1 Tax=Paramecium sonneborni TaxID=65129 RepID=A0A8S1RSF8_9CILI|nr:unnamed protein product [Paramecium sonneborni]